VRSRLYPGKQAVVPLAGLTDDRFGIVLNIPGPAAEADAARQLLHEYHAVSIAERNEEERP
jgi:hypothetical protein